jgi:Flp pilus assembly pilin Flp
MKQPPQLMMNQNGQGLTEYLILLILISVISITAVRSLGSTVKDKLQIAREKINSVSVQ